MLQFLQFRKILNFGEKALRERSLEEREKFIESFKKFTYNEQFKFTKLFNKSFNTEYQV